MLIDSQVTPTRELMVFHRFVLISTAILFCFTRSLSAATPVEVDAALQKATAFLLDQEKNGNWEVTPAPAPDVRGVDISGGQWSGTSALVTYALLCAHVSTSDPHLVSAIDFLDRTETQGTYALGLRCLVWSALQLNPRTRAAAIRDMRQLLNNMRSKGPALGMFYYLPPVSSQGKVPRVYGDGIPPPDDAEYDHSVSQFAALGLWALGRQGFEVPTEAWRLMDRGWRAHQDPSGGWGYVFQAPGSHGKVTPSMTAAGVATLLITEECLHPAAECKGNLVDPAVEMGIKHLADSFDGITDVDNFMDGKCETRYTLFGISRIGVASGRKYLAKIDWYRRGCDLLVSAQQPDGQLPDGSWNLPHSPTVETALGTLFLTYGGAPVVVNKLDYSAPGKAQAAHWNQRPQDLLNFASWMAKETEQRLNWQVVTLAGPREDLHEAPVLSISGNETINLTPAEKNSLRQFAEDGGLILGNADCNSALFSRSFEKLGHELFPNYEFRQLPEDHPIFSNEQYPAKKWKPRPQLTSISNGVRELMMIPNADLSQQFQLRNDVTHSALYQLADDIILYAMDKQGLRKKGITYLVNQDPTVATTSQIKLLRLQYDGNWDPEPGGWRRLAALMNNQNKVKLTVTAVKLDPGKLGDPKVTGTKIAHLTGTDAVKLTQPQLEELRQFTASGGTLIIDAAGGSPAFASSASDIIINLFGDDGAKAIKSPLPPTSDLYKASGAPLTEFTYRAYARSQAVGALRSPRICAVKQGNRIVCYFSREDLSAGLVGQPIDGIIGYDPATATAIMRDILLFASK
jgi:hypothetical protein